MIKNHYPMKSDVKDKKDAYLLEIELPGCKKEDIKAYVENGYLYVTAMFHKKAEGKYIRRECYSGEYTRSFFIGKNIDVSDIKISYRLGILKALIPKENKPQKKDTQIKIA